MQESNNSFGQNQHLILFHTLFFIRFVLVKFIFFDKFSTNLAENGCVIWILKHYIDYTKYFWLPCYQWFFWPCQKFRQTLKLFLKSRKRQYSRFRSKVCLAGECPMQTYCFEAFCSRILHLKQAEFKTVFQSRSWIQVSMHSEEQKVL